MPHSNLGLGLGLRNCHFNHILSAWPAVDWFEAISENFMDSGGWPRHVIRQVAEHYPLALHGVSLSIGSTEPLNFDYLKKLKNLATEVQAAWISDHLCWTGVQGINSHDLLPLPLTEQSLKHTAGRVAQVQDFLGRELVLENPSTYITFTQSTLSEPDFLRELCKQTGCQLLLDVNNVYVSAFNSGTDAIDYIEQFPCEHVIQMHLAGHQHCGTHIIDTHDRTVRTAVWELFRLAWLRTGGVASLLEWDGNIPPFEQCHAEILKAKDYMLGEFDPANVAISSETEKETISNPVGFLVPGVMDRTQAEGA